MSRPSPNFGSEFFASDWKRFQGPEGGGASHNTPTQNSPKYHSDR